MIPITWMAGGLAIAVALSGVSGYVAGRKSRADEMNALRRSYELAAAQAAGREAERVRVWTNAAKVAGEKYDADAKRATQSHDASLDRLRNAYESTRGLRLASTAPQGCPGPSGPSAADLLRAGEVIAGLARDADQDRAALVACVSAWPR